MNDEIFEIWHNPRCGKSREALEILQSAGVNPTIREYLKDVPTVDELEFVCQAGGFSPLEITRIKEPLWAENSLDPKTLSDQDLLEMLSFYPKGIERPIVIKGGDIAVLGRPLANIETLLLSKTL